MASEDVDVCGQAGEVGCRPASNEMNMGLSGWDLSATDFGGDDGR